MHTSAPRDPEKEARIFASATHIFAKNGYQNAKTDEIAADADVSKGLLFHYFGSKANLYIETIRRTYAKLTGDADHSVWQDAPDLNTMVSRALRYKIQMQLDYPDEFNLALVAYSNNATLPAKMQQQLADIWNSELQNEVPALISPVLKRMHLRPGISVNDVIKLVTAISMLIGEQAKVMVQNNPNIKIAEFDSVVNEAIKYMDILEHGFLAE
ncbi:TetR/AcrR family transcriptional regulator [Lacticaseibacillus hulanensis]|uniref:TetR/AcrR family transcriptional regulator n=1 Tax=Lacticaseibacillus hulanensis TaxID=2493111 RepID=UPI000FDA7D00|nr:TetR/AcrR family transcriptional regulator [Lacticaseibacillus hulanensis]